MAQVVDRLADPEIVHADARRKGSARRTREHPDEEALHRLVVVGGGAAGLELVTRLGDRLGRRSRASVTLIECARAHLWKPLLHAVAAGSHDPSQYEVSYLAQAHWHGFRYRLGEMVGLDRAGKEVRLAATCDDEGRQITPERSIGYDTLVIAIGSVTNDFGTPGVAKYAVPLETPAQAERFNRRVFNACLRAQTQTEPVRPGQLHVAIVGAGAAGTELAAELFRTIHEVVGSGLDRIDPHRDVRVVLIEGSPRILPGLPERISQAAHRLLDEMGVEVRTSALVKEVTAKGLKLADGSIIASELIVWGAGVKAPEVLQRLDGLETNRINQLVVEPTLQTTRDPDIFAIGDCAACPRPGVSTPVPPRAQAAHQEASHMFRQIERRLRGKPLQPYAYRDFGSLVSLGKWSTVGNLMGFLSGHGVFVEGLFARTMYQSLRLMHDRALGGSRRAALALFARALARQIDPPVKLHRGAEIVIGLTLKMNNGAPLAISNGVKVAGAPALSVDDSLCAKLLPFVLSVAAGSVDIIGFLGLNGLFTAHVTGNVVVLAAKLVAHEEAPLAYLISVPVFMAVLALTALLAAALEQRQILTLLPLLLLQFLLLSAFFATSLAPSERIDPNTARMIFAGMLGVSAMAVQNALVRLSLTGAPSTAVMTTNITNFTTDVAEMLLGREPGMAESARDRARRTWPAIVGFLLGCALGAACEKGFGLPSLALPAGCALLSLALGAVASLNHGKGHPSKRRAI